MKVYCVRLVSCVVFGLFAVVPTDYAFSQDKRIKITRGKTPIAGLKLRARVRYVKSKKKFELGVRGRYDDRSKGLTLAKRRLVVANAKKRLFSIRTFLKARKKRVVFTSVDARGKRKREIVVFEVIPQDKSFAKRKRSHRFGFGFGPTFIEHTQTDRPNYRAWAFTLKGGYSFHFFKRFEIGVSTFANIATLSENEDYQARFLGLNARAGVVIPGLPRYLTLKVLVGFYYLRMSSKDLVIGFSDVMGPQVFPVLIARLADRHSIDVYGKFSPISSGVGFLDPGENREAAFGMGYTYKFMERSQFDLGSSIRIDYSDLALSGEANGSTIRLNTKTISIGLGISVSF